MERIVPAQGSGTGPGLGIVFSQPAIRGIEMFSVQRVLLLLLALILAIGSAHAWSSKAQDLDHSALPVAGTVTGTVGGITYSGNPLQITSFTVTPNGGTAVVITVPPSAENTTAIENFRDKKPTVEYHTSGVPAANIIDSIAQPS